MSLRLTTDMVREFMHTFDQTTADHVLSAEEYSPEITKLRVHLVVQEALEFAEACGYDIIVDGERVPSQEFEMSKVDEPNVVDVADALADLQYVLDGSALAFGIPHHDVVTEVHRSNMTKLDADGNVIRGPHNRVMKSELYEPPNIPEVLRAAGWAG